MTNLFFLLKVIGSATEFAFGMDSEPVQPV